MGVSPYQKLREYAKYTINVYSSFGNVFGIFYKERTLIQLDFYLPISHLEFVLEALLSGRPWRPLGEIVPSFHIASATES